MTLRMRELPQFFGAVFGKIRAASETAFLVNSIPPALTLYADRLLNPHWGEQMRFGPGNEFEIAMVFQGLRRSPGGRGLDPVPRMAGCIEARLHSRGSTQDRGPARKVDLECGVFEDA